MIPRDSSSLSAFPSVDKELSDFARFSASFSQEQFSRQSDRDKLQSKQYDLNFYIKHK